MSGVIVERRDQVRMTCFWRDSFIAAIFLQQMLVDKRTLLDRTRHRYLPFLRWTIYLSDELILSRLITLGRLAPGGHRMVTF